MLNEKLKNIYNDVPSEFSTAVRDTLKSLDEKAQKAYSRHRVLKTVLVGVLIAAVLSTSVLGAVKLSGMFTVTHSDYKIEIQAVPEETVRDVEFVSLELTYLPEGVIEMQNTHGMKYSLNGEGVEKWITVQLIKLDTDFDNILNYVTETSQTQIGKYEVIKTKRAFSNEERDKSKFWYIYDNELNMVVELMASGDLSDDEITKVIEGLKLTECEKEDNFGYTLSSQLKGDEAPQRYTERFYEYNVEELGESFDYKGDSLFVPPCKITVNGMKTLDNVSELESDSFILYEYYPNGDSVQYSDCFDSSGNVIKNYVREIIEFGDGETTIDSVAHVDSTREFVLVDLTVSSDEYDMSVDVFHFQLAQVDVQGDKCIRNGHDKFNGNLVCAVTDEGNILNINKGETKNIQLGYFVDSSLIQSLGMIFPSFGSSVGGAYNSEVIKNCGTCVMYGG